MDVTHRGHWCVTMRRSEIVKREYRDLTSLRIKVLENRFRDEPPSDDFIKGMEVGWQYALRWVLNE